MNRELVKGGFTLKEIISAGIVTLACAYLALAHILPQANTYITTNISPEVSLWYRLGVSTLTAITSSAAGASAAWVTGRFQKK